MTTPQEHIALAAQNDSGMYLTVREVQELAAYHGGCKYDLSILREANTDFARDAADAETHADELALLIRDLRQERDDARAVADTVMAQAERLRAELDDTRWALSLVKGERDSLRTYYAKEVRRLIEERDEARRERDSFYAQLKFANDTTEMLAAQMRRDAKLYG